LLKFSLLRSKIQPVLLETFEDMPGDLMVFRKCLQVDQDVIEVDTYHSFHDEILEYVIHHHLEGGWAVGESKEHHQGLKQPSVSLKCCLPLIFLSDPNIVVTPSNIQLGEVLHIMELVDELWDEGNRVLILDCHCIQGLIVLYQPKGTVFLFDEEDWQGHRGLQWSNVS